MANFKYKKSTNKDNYIVIFSFISLFITLALLFSGVISYRLNIFSISVSLSIFTKYAVYLAIFTSIISLVSLGYSFKRHSKMLAVFISLITFLVSAFIIVIFYGYIISLKSYPFMNDITTNYDDKISFKIAKHNPIGDENSFLQRYGGFNKPYNKLKSVYINNSNIEEIFNKSIFVFTKMNINITYQNLEEGIIEGEAVSFWYGFKDDFIVRIEKLISDDIKIDIRSASRSGRSDFGKNYERILQFISYF